MIREKIEQATQIPDELGLDAWMLLGREPMTSVDPCSDLVVGAFYTLPAAYVILRRGETVARPTYKNGERILRCAPRNHRPVRAGL